VLAKGPAERLRLAHSTGWVSESKQCGESSQYRLQALYQPGVPQILDFIAGITAETWLVDRREPVVRNAEERIGLAANLAFRRQIS
jgi:hypothetical protein